MFKLGQIEAEFQSGQIIVYQMKGKIRQILRSYPPLPEEKCPICMSSKFRESCHNGFLNETDKPIPSKLMICGYYKRNEIDRLTEDFWKVRSLPENCLSTEIPKIIEALAKLIINSSSIKYTHMICVPSREEKKDLIPLIAKNVASEFEIHFLESDEWIDHDISLHNQKHVREVATFDSRIKLISKLYKSRKELGDKLPGAKILIFDDLVQTGLTMNRIGRITIGYGAKLVHGFAFLRAAEGKILEVS